MKNKNLLVRLIAAACVACGIGVAALVVSVGIAPPNAKAQDGSYGLREIVDNTGTNAFGFSSTNSNPYIRAGTNFTYATGRTNFVVTNGASVRTFTFDHGILIGVQ